jgi:ABC-type amino acid transport substrate-binding protein
MLILILTISFPLASQEVLRSSYYSQNVEPQLFFDNRGRPISGILFDISNEIAKKLDMKLEMIPIPRKRIEQSLVKGIMDMHCVANPQWYQSKHLQWSSTLYKNPDILINNKGIKSLAELANYKNLKVGTSLGYIYPELLTYIDNKNILPVTSLSPGDSYKKYRKNKVSGFIIPEIEASPFVKEITDSVVLLNDNEISCVLAPSMKKSRVNSISNAIDQLKASGEIDAILSKYNINNQKLANQHYEILAD